MTDIASARSAGPADAVSSETTDDTRRARGALPDAEAREAEFRLMAEMMPQLVWTTTPDGYHDYYNARWYEYTGMPREGAQGWNWKHFLHPDDVERTERAWAHSLATGEPYEVEYRFRRAADGAYRWFVGRAAPLRDGSGRVRRWFGTCTDIDEAKHAEWHFRVLAEAGAALVATVDTDAALRAVAHLAVPRLADWCVFDLLDERGALRRAAVHHADPARLDAARLLAERYPASNDAALAAAEVARSGKAQLVESVPDELLVSTARDADHLRALRELGVRSYVCVPLRRVGVGGQVDDAADRAVLGALTLVSAEAGRRYGRRDLATAEELARRVAGALERTRLYEEAVTSRAEIAAQVEQLAQQTAELEFQNEQLQQQATELEMQNEQMQQQAVELEMQNEQLQQQAAELEVQTEQLQQQTVEMEMQTEQLQQQATEMEMTNEQLQEQAAELEAQATQLAEQTVELEGANAALARARSEMVRVFEQAPVAICVLRGPALVFELANARYAELLRGRPLIGKRIADAIPELDASVLAILGRVMSEKEPFVATEFRVALDRAGSAEECYFNLVYQPLLDDAGAASGVVVVATEVTELVRARKEAEEARAQAEAANEAKSHFLATMSHELRTPLNAVTGYADLLTLGIRGPVTEAQRDDLERIKRSGQHLLSVINDILHFAKLEAGQIEFELTDVPIEGALAEVETLIAPQLSAKRLAYHFVGCDEGGARVVAHADRERCQQIVLNLLTNAVKFTPEGGRITVACAADGERVFVRVSDTGIGIPADKVASVFDPFVQVSRKLNRPSEGVGLGLAISRDLARGMGGDLTAESEPGKGSTFTLTLPRKK